MTNHVRIINDGSRSYVIEIDGHPVQNCTDSLTYHASATTVPALELRLVLFHGAEIDVTAAVRVDDETAAALQAIGWMAPTAQEGTP